MLSTLPSTLGLLIASWLWPQEQSHSSSLTFQLRHQHGTANNTLIVLSDVPQTPAGLQASGNTFSVKTLDVTTHRPTSLMGWDEVDVKGPNTTDRETLLQLAMMTANAYEQDPSSKDWYDLGPDWNSTYPFGWEPDADGFRGQVFVSTDNSTVVISIKGTSAGWYIGGGGPTVKKDKLNDNLLFSCCCAKVGPTWSPVCNCHSGGYKCDQNCLEKSLAEDTLFYPIGTNLYNNISYIYPDANIWLVGHSLGGALATLVGATFGAPVVAYESPPEKLAASRLHLVMPPSTQHITHVFHTADPLPMGTCNGVSSGCALVGFAFESSCHLGQIIKYDTVTKYKWSVGLSTHPIKSVIENVLNKDWDPENGISVPAPEEQVDCVDCFSWEFGDFNQSC